VRTFAYARPDTLEELLALLDEHGPEAKLLAGGTDLIVRLRWGDSLPRIVIDLKKVEALGPEIAVCDTGLRIGARTVMSDLIADRRVQSHFPALMDAARAVGSVQIRNRATLAGNICNASPAADTAPALLVYGATVNLVGLNGRRAVPVTDFFLEPGRTVLKRGELVESIGLPFASEPCGAAFGRTTRRRGVDVAIVNLCCLVKTSGETLMACGAMGPRPLLVRGNRAVILDELVAQARPISDIRGGRDYRLAMLAVLAKRCLASATRELQSALAGVGTACDR
jgi:CO/xanthine dehydrogenase FAD-binding subunit